jgi:hypothetical protein
MCHTATIDVPIEHVCAVYAEVARIGLNGKPFFVAGINNHYLIFGSPREVTLVLDAKRGGLLKVRRPISAGAPPGIDLLPG